MTSTSETARIDRGELAAAVAAGNIPTLVAVLYQLTGDRAWLEDPYAPQRDRGLGDNDSGGLAQEIQDEIRAAAVEAVAAWADGLPPAHPTLDGDDLIEVLGVTMGAPVPAEFGPMLAETLGFTGRMPRKPSTPPPSGFSVVVIGAGVSGLVASIKLAEAGVEHVLLEKNEQVGGTWYENRYPGAGVDTPSYLYSLSFHPGRWPAHFARRDDVQRYLEDVADRFAVRPRIRFGYEVTDLEWDDAAATWSVRALDRADEEHTFVANAVISAVGQLNRAKIPDLPGMDAFGGTMFHSAQWPDGVDLAGARVAVIGSGASAMQIVPAVAKDVERLTVFQRSPQWIAEAPDIFRPYDERQHWLMEHVPFYLGWYRARLAWTYNDTVHPTLQINPDWDHPERSVNKVNDAHRRVFTRYLHAKLDGRPDLAVKALPTYPPFGKRMLLDNGWFDAIRLPQVELLAEGVAEMTPTGVRGDAGTERDVDVIILATGFEAHRLLHPMRVRGRQDRVLTDVWGEEDAAAHRGITVPGFPNLFLTSGPNTILGHGGSHITMAECQVRYIVDVLCRMVDDHLASVEVRDEVYEESKAAVDDAHSRMIWSHSGMSTWYRNAKGRVVSTLPFRVVDYWTSTREAELEEFHVERADPLTVQDAGR